MLTNWKKLITKEMKHNKDSWNNMEHCTLTKKELLKQFDDDYGSSKGDSFTLWTKKYVYFPAVYDGAEWCASVRRNPCDISKSHVGGE